MATDKALPLNGGGLGGGAAVVVTDKVRSAPAFISSTDTSAAPPSPALPPLRGKGDFDRPNHAAGAVKWARRMRQAPTASEAKLWKELRKLDLGIRRQAPIGRYIADFAQHSAKLVIEVDVPRHDLEDAQLHDHLRDEWLKSQGYRVIRVRDTEAFEEPQKVAARIAAALTGQE